MSRLRLSLFPLLPLLAACATGLSGRYDLQTINDETFPVWPLTALDVELNEDGTCRISGYTDDPDTPVTDDDCTWTAEGTTITFLRDDGETLTGAVANGTMTFTDSEGRVFVFVRRSRAGY